MEKILFVDDDLKYQFIIKELLETAGYTVDTASDVADGFSLFKETEYDLVLTDLRMEGVDGLQFLELLRKKKENIKVIMLTGANDDAAEVQGLILDVDDYIKKPVGFEVLLKRIELVLKQKRTQSKRELHSESAGLVVNLNRHNVAKNEKEIELSNTEYNLLVFLLQNKNIVFSREEILKEVWHTTFVDMRTVDTHIKKLRKKLNISNIFSIRGVGYEWVE